MADDSDRAAAGTVRPARTDKAGCGIRFAADELQTGIDFSGARHLQHHNRESRTNDRSIIATGENRPDQGHH